MNKDNIFNKVNNHLIYLADEKPDFGKLLSQLLEYGDVLIFGGAVRDILFNNPPRDYDFVVNFNSSILERALSDIQSRRNSFEGYKAIVDGLKLDIWSLEKTWAFRENLLPTSPENLAESVFYNFDSIVVHLSQGEVYARRYFEAIEKNMLEIVLKQNPFPELCVLRALVFKNKNNIRFSPEVEEFISDWKKEIENPINKLNETQHKHYGEEILNCNRLAEEIAKF